MPATPLKSIRKYCLWCMCGSAHEITLCPANETNPVCPLWPLRLNRGVKGVSNLKSIRAKCIDCSESNKAEVRNCQFKACPLYPYRMGHNPRLKGRGLSPEKMAEVRAKIGLPAQESLTGGMIHGETGHEA